MSYKKFKFNGTLTQEQKDFFHANGFIHFEEYAPVSIVHEIIDSTERVQDDWVSRKVEKINGIPVKYGQDENGKEIVHRFPFTNQYSQAVQKLVSSAAFTALKDLLPADRNPRIALNEKDGVVLNHYVTAESSNYTQLGWHTDGARDIFYGTKVEPMLNVGFYLDDSPKEKGSLRVLPGSHRQSVWSLLFKKKYFVDNTADKNEVIVEAKAGDLVVHHGSIWHRVAPSQLTGAASRRRVMYTPIVVGKVEIKDANSKTPFYHRFGRIVFKKKQKQAVLQAA
jgi:phytanoyl-CoA hydroxylase